MKLCIPISDNVSYWDEDNENTLHEGYAVAEFEKSGEMLGVQRPQVSEDAPSLSIEVLLAKDIPWRISCLNEEDIEEGTYIFMPGRVVLGSISPDISGYFFECDTDNAVIGNKIYPISEAA